jgi:hypothetical protein
MKSNMKEAYTTLSDGSSTVPLPFQTDVKKVMALLTAHHHCKDADKGKPTAYKSRQGLPLTGRALVGRATLVIVAAVVQLDAHLEQTSDEGNFLRLRMRR